MLFSYIFFSYIGPGLGAGTVLLVTVVLLIVLASILTLVWVPIKKFFKAILSLFSGK